MWDSYLKAVETYKPTIASILYHYCPIGSLRFLLEPGADISCHYLSCMGKDCEELHYGIRLFFDYLRDKGGIYKELADKLHEIMESILGGKGNNAINRMIPATFSFTEKEYSSYHRNTYCKNGGVAISFRHDKLDAAIDGVIRHGVSLRLIPCFYEDVNKREINCLIEAVFNDVDSLLKNVYDSNFTDTKSIIDSLCEVVTFAEGIKRKKFYKDEEWRLVLVKQRNKYDTGEFVRSGIVDYCQDHSLLDLMTGLRIRQDFNRRITNLEIDKFNIQSRAKYFARFKSV